MIAADLFAQPVPGTYTSKIGMQLYRIRISADSTYERSSYIELAHGVHRSRGFWFLQGDTVILKQAPWGAQYSSHTAEVIDSLSQWNGPRSPGNLQSNATDVTIHVYDVSGKPVENVILWMFDKDSLTTSLSVKRPEDTSIFIRQRHFSKLKIGKMGFMPAEVTLDSLWGYKARIRVILLDDRHDSYSEKPATYKFLWNRKNNTLTYPGSDSVYRLEIPSPE